MGDRIVVMKDGAIRQVGTPLELYDDPNDVFVATFIGSPPMNILTTTVESDALVLGDGTRMQAPARLIAALGVGRSLKLGLRAEQLQVGPQADRPAGRQDQLRAEAVVRERDNLGQDVIAALDLGGDRVTVRTDRNAGADPGATVRLAAEVGNVRFFDPKSDRRIRVSL